MIDIVISPANEKPIYRQIAEQLSSQILNGSLSAGSALPPIRNCCGGA